MQKRAYCRGHSRIYRLSRTTIRISSVREYIVIEYKLNYPIIARRRIFDPMESYLYQSVVLTVSGIRYPVAGRLVDLGPEILVLQDGKRFIYVPLVHVRQLTRNLYPENKINEPSEPPLDPASELSYRKILIHAKGMFSELHLSGDQTVQGYVTSIMNDYFVFYTPLFRTLYVSMKHMKMLVPFDPRESLYAPDQGKFAIFAASTSLARTFDQQTRKFENEFVILDLGALPQRMGVLGPVRNNMLELVTANGFRTFIHSDHVKTIHRP